MKLLIVTQAVDETDPILGFFTAWITEFAKHCEELTIIAQRTGTYTLPQNVQVLSLGKEKRRNKCLQVATFWKHIWKKRNHYDAVLVHMTPIWVVLGGVFWALYKKPVYLWYLHRNRTMLLRIALMFVRHVFAATDINNGAAGQTMIVTGHGIDTTIFTPQTKQERKPLIVAVGRITAIKNFDECIAAFIHLPEEYMLHIVGAPYTPEDDKVLQALQEQILQAGIERRVQIKPANRRELIDILQVASLFVHTTSGGLDKAALEAMACQCPVVSTAPAFHAMLPGDLCASRDNLAETVCSFLSKDRMYRERIAFDARNIITQKHSLTNVVTSILSKVSSV